MAFNTTPIQWSAKWSPPPLSALNFNESDPNICGPAAAFLASIVNPPDSYNEPINYNETRAAYLAAILPASVPRPDNYTLSLWWDSLYFGTSEAVNATWNQIVDFPFNCSARDICPRLEWSGDQDVAGRGILISYYVAAGLSTVYFLALSPRLLGLIKDPKLVSLPKSKGMRLVESFQESLTSFLDSTLIFEVAMFAAAAVRFSHGFLQADGSQLAKGEWDFYSLIISPYMAIFSVFPALILQSIETKLPRSWFRILVWVLTAILAIVNEALFESFFTKIYDIAYGGSPITPGQYTALGRTEQEFIWISLCSGANLLIRGILPTYYLGLGLLGVNTIAWTIYHAIKHKPKNGKWPRLHAFFHKWGPFIRTVNATVCFLVMWAMLGLFTAYRIEVDSLANPDNENEIWTFGQVVALTAWIPAILEFFTILTHGPEKGLSVKVSTRYQVVPSDNDTIEKPHLQRGYSGVAMRDESEATFYYAN